MTKEEGTMRAASVVPIAPERSITFQSVQKTSADLNVTFPEPFKYLPVVLASPVWLRGGQLKSIETVTEVTNTGCKITSGNYGPSDHFVNVVAIDTDTKAFGTLPFIAGTAHKHTASVDVTFPKPSPLQSPEPVVILTPLWLGTAGPVGSIETLNHSSPSEMDIVSGNSAPKNYLVSYAVADRGHVVRDEGGELETGSVNKTAGNVPLTVYFSSAFRTAPIVVVSAWYKGAGAPAQGQEAIIDITSNYFTIFCEIAAPNYFVNWMAFAD